MEDQVSPLQVAIAAMTLVRDNRLTGTSYLIVGSRRYQVGDVARVLWLEATCHSTWPQYLTGTSSLAYHTRQTSPCHAGLLDTVEGTRAQEPG